MGGGGGGGLEEHTTACPRGWGEVPGRSIPPRDATAVDVVVQPVSGHLPRFDPRTALQSQVTVSSE